MNQDDALKRTADALAELDARVFELERKREAIETRLAALEELTRPMQRYGGILNNAG